ncbi:MAG TPA: (2Fe-2S)-binding protein, partial [Homoserinimonas sp.]|nr:(2Fe-2S)-binding protein [Homoserinimonas sp.]
CRCEEVDYGSLCSQAAATGSQSLRSLKLSTRAGLGICQGRVCGRTVEQLLSQAANTALTDGTMSDRRPIAVPIRLGELASPPSPFSTPTKPPHGSRQAPTKGTP